MGTFYYRSAFGGAGLADAAGAGGGAVESWPFTLSRAVSNSAISSAGMGSPGGCRACSRRGSTKEPFFRRR
jgi:hypothetical protein